MDFVSKLAGGLMASVMRDFSHDEARDGGHYPLPVGAIVPYARSATAPVTTNAPPQIRSKLIHILPSIRSPSLR